MNEQLRFKGSDYTVVRSENGRFYVEGDDGTRYGPYFDEWEARTEAQWLYEQ